MAGRSSEDLGACADAVARAVKGMDDLPESGPVFECLETALRSVRVNLRGTPCATFALETALLDLVSQRRGVSVAHCARRADGPIVVALPTNGVLRCGQRTGAMRDARNLVARGIRVIKWKWTPSECSVAALSDVLRAVRGECGQDVRFRIDANGAMSVDDARRAMDTLANTGLEYFEQPVRSADLSRLGECAVPWAADEALEDSQVAESVLALPGCAVAVLKPQFLGWSRAWDIASFARGLGRAVVVGHAFDGPVGLASACELALALPGIDRASGLDRHALLDAPPSIRVPQSSGDGFVRPSTMPGLGLSAADRSALRG